MHNASRKSRRAKRNKFGDKPGKFPEPSTKHEARAYPDGKLVPSARNGLVRDMRTGSYDKRGAAIEAKADWMALANVGKRRNSTYNLVYIRKDGTKVNTGRPQRIGGLQGGSGPTKSSRKAKASPNVTPDTRPKVRTQWRDMGRSPDAVEIYRTQPVACDHDAVSFGQPTRFQSFTQRAQRAMLVRRMVKALTED